MFNLSGRQPQPRRMQDEESTRQPLLDEEDRNPVLFSTDGDEQETEDVLGHDNGEDEDRPPRGRSVHFEEEVRVIAPPLRSTMASREAGN